jgi:hypothetical protein
MISNSNGNLVLCALNNLIDSTQDFTDSLYVKNDQRERIIGLQNEIREKTLNYLRVEEQDSNVNKLNNSGDDLASSSSSKNLFSNLCSPILNDCEILKKILLTQTMQLADQLFRDNQDATLLSCIKTYSLSNHYDLLIETLDKFKDYSEHVLEICKFLRHVSQLDVFEVTCEHHHAVFENLAKMIQSSSGTAALYPTCKSAVENLQLYCDCWESQINDLSILVKEMQDFIHGIKSNKSIYLSLPRPGVRL